MGEWPMRSMAPIRRAMPVSHTVRYSALTWNSDMTPQEIDEFRAWHTARLTELCYPPSIVSELTEARERWLAGVKRK
jgi:hypothetical protein